MVAGGHAWLAGGGGVHRIRRDTVNERAVRILLECILVCEIFLPLLSVQRKTYVSNNLRVFNQTLVSQTSHFAVV